MKIVYLANAYGHISGPTCDELYKIYGDDFVFIATEELDDDRKGVGSGSDRKFIINANEDKAYAKKLCDEAEVLIFGAAPHEYLENRIKENKLTIYYSERLFKGNILRYMNPITLGRIKERFVKPSKNSNFHLLCASSFAALDFSRVGAFKGKMYKWGYQPAVYEKDIDELMASKQSDGLEFIWVGRLVALKHCDHALRVVANLKKMGYAPRLTVIGTGEEEDNLKALAIKLGIEDNVIFKGRCLIEDTREMMDRANIFMFTSDFKEGWGATLNECMNSGVACVASHGAGATNFLAKDKENALLYVSGDVEMLTEKVRSLVDDRNLRESIGREAYRSITEEWNPAQSYKRLIAFIEELKKKGKCELYTEGPLSPALPLKHNWYKG